MEEGARPGMTTHTPFEPTAAGSGTIRPGGFGFSRAMPMTARKRKHRRTGSRSSLEEDLWMPHKLMFRLALVAGVLALVLAVPTAFAGKPGGGGSKGSKGSGTISLVLLDSTDGLPHFGQEVTFEVFASSTSQPWVELLCYKNGTHVYRQANGIFPGSLDQTFTLGPTPLWQGGEADCTAYLQDWDSYSKNGKIQNLASISFRVYP
jgi:hypothetical protein